MRWSVGSSIGIDTLADSIQSVSKAYSQTCAAANLASCHEGTTAQTWLADEVRRSLVLEWTLRTAFCIGAQTHARFDIGPLKGIVTSNN